MKIVSLLTLGLALTLGMVSIEAEARRLGGGRSSGMQRQMPARTAPDSTPAKPAAPAQQAAPAAAPKRNWMGPLAGLAAGLGLAALFSHLGMGGAFGSFVLMALLAVAAIVVVRMLMRRKQQAQPAGMAYRGNEGASGQVAWPAAAGNNMPAADPGHMPTASATTAEAAAPIVTAP